MVVERWYGVERRAVGRWWKWKWKRGLVVAAAAPEPNDDVLCFDAPGRHQPRLSTPPDFPTSLVHPT
jgi:hypothetical protein